MQAFEAVIRIRLNPDIIGPDAKPYNEDGTLAWNTEASASDYLTEVLSSQQWETILDWGYENVSAEDKVLGWSTVEHSDDYEEGEMFSAAL
jgi:hypothetical protein